MSTARTRRAAEEETIAIGSRKVTVTHPDRILFPDDGITKADLVHYYRDVAHWLLPYVEGRPLTLQRWPNGIDGFSFFEKQAPRGMPAWIARSAQPSTGRRAVVEYPVCNDAPALLWLANLATITLHVWMSRVGSIDTPDFLLYDHDPFEGCTVRTLAKVALTLRDELATVGLTPLVKTTGGKGLHAIVPLAPGCTYGAGRDFNELVARRVRLVVPDAVTLERSKAKRARGTVYFDWAQFGKGRTYVPPFVVRARPRAPVSMPLEWTEVEELAHERSAKPTNEVLARWTMKNVPALLAERGDPWKRPFGRGQRLEPALAKARAKWA